MHIEQRIDIEEMRDSLRLAVAQYAQAIPALASQGQDPSEVIKRIAEVIQGRQKGLQLETIVEKAFAPPPAPPQPEQPQMMAPEQQISAAGAVPTAPSQAPPSPVGATPAAGQAPMNIDEILAAIGGAA